MIDLVKHVHDECFALYSLSVRGYDRFHLSRQGICH